MGLTELLFKKTGIDLRGGPLNDEELLGRIREYEARGAKLEKLTIRLSEGCGGCVWDCDPYSKEQEKAFEFYFEPSAVLSYQDFRTKKQKEKIISYRTKRFYIVMDDIHNRNKDRLIDFMGGCTPREKNEFLEYYARYTMLQEALETKDWFDRKGIKAEIKYKD